MVGQRRPVLCGAWVKVRFADFHHTTVEDIHALLTELALHALLVQALMRRQPVRLWGGRAADAAGRATQRRDTANS